MSKVAGLRPSYEQPIVVPLGELESAQGARCNFGSVATTAMLFCEMVLKPSWLARNWRSTGKGVPAMAPDPSGRTEARSRSCARRWRSRWSGQKKDSHQWVRRSG